MDALSATSADRLLELMMRFVQEATTGVLAPKEASSIASHVLGISTSWMIKDDGE